MPRLAHDVRSGPSRTWRTRPILRVLLAALLMAPAPRIASAGPGSDRSGASTMPMPAVPPILLEQFEAYLRDRDLETFRREVSQRYTEGTLVRLLDSPEVRARRASVLALGQVASFQSNAAVARGLRDVDPIVRELAHDALWSIWFRADRPDNNQTLREVRDLIAKDRLDAAETLATRLIERAPQFAEAYNQRAIARFLANRFRDSADDCRQALDRNPYHIGALGGLAQCHMKLDDRPEALAALRRALKLQPFNEGLRQTVAILEGED